MRIQPESIKRLSIRRCTGSLVLAACALSAHATAVLDCDVSYAGTTHHISARPVADPYGVESVDIGGRFFFKPVVVGRGNRVDYVLLYAYLDQDPRPVMVQEAKYLPPFRSGKKPYLLTGEQHLYAGPVERELIYSCWLGGVAP
jgi:hypothetical protein